jgi:hypothetical protein
VQSTRTAKIGPYDGTTGSNIEDDFDSLFADVAALSLTGGGTEPETVIVKNYADSAAIQGARVTIRTLDQSTIKVDGLTTDVNGKRILDLDADSFFVALTANNYTQQLDTLVVAAGGGTDTFYMTQFDPGSASGALCRVYNYVKDGEENPIKGVKVTAIIDDDFWPIRYDEEARVVRVSVETDTLGYWYMDIYPNTILLTAQGDSSSYYIFEGKKGSETLFKYNVTVPADSAFKMVPDDD